MVVLGATLLGILICGDQTLGTIGQARLPPATSFFAERCTVLSVSNCGEFQGAKHCPKGEGGL